jgi:hypothetical protein
MKHGEVGEILTTTVLHFGEDAHALLVRFMEQFEPRLGPHGDLHEITDWAGKLTGFLVRIAGILHLADGNASLTIDATTLSRALAMETYFVEHALAAFGQAGAHKGSDVAARIVRWVRRNGTTSFSRRELYEAIKGRLGGVDELDDPLDRLVELNYLRRIATHRSGPGRAPSPRFEVNPHVLAPARRAGTVAAHADDAAWCSAPGEVSDSHNSQNGSAEATIETSTDVPPHQGPEPPDSQNSQNSSPVPSSPTTSTTTEATASAPERVAPTGTPSC